VGTREYQSTGFTVKVNRTEMILKEFIESEFERLDSISLYKAATERNIAVPNSKFSKSCKSCKTGLGL
jgi:hypothetical protein